MKTKLLVLGVISVVMLSFGYNNYPVVCIDGQIEGTIEQQDFVKNKRLKLHQKDRKSTCSIHSYVMWYTQPDYDPIEINSDQAEFTGKVAKAVSLAKPGDEYLFFDIKVQCAGSDKPMQVNNLSFKIK